MKKKYSQNYQVEIFIDQLVMLYILKKDFTITNNYRLICIIKKILYQNKYGIQTKFD